MDFGDSRRDGQGRVAGCHLGSCDGAAAPMGDPLHALVAGVGALRRLTMMDEWAKLAGQARIRPVRRQGLVRKYL